MQQQFTLNRTGGLEGVDFRALGFRCGLEIHHQILTDKKLFCRCPAGRYSDEYHAEVLRHMRPTLSELGEYDGTALMEFKTHKEIIYRLHKDTVCTYEMDDTPPFPVNQQAIDIAIEIALLLNCKIVDEIHIIRKQYLDGSIPTGFQRTAIIGWDGWIPYKGRKIGITQLALEEDACREVSDHGHTITFLTDRLSIPLIEVVTEPHMLDPVEAADVGGILGTLLRLTGKVRRGYGSARQDVNVSITSGQRVEIKGVPKLGYLPRLTAFEALRQKSLLELRREVISRGFKDESDLEYEVKDLTSIAKDIRHRPLQKNLPAKNGGLKAVLFKGLKSVFAFKLVEGWTFADEVAARVRVIACLDKRPNLAHTDAGTGMTLSQNNVRIVKKQFSHSNEDLIVLVWGPTQDVDTAIAEIIIRVKEILQGIINETRQHRINGVVKVSGVSDFERILPGPDRMYPDTDSPPTAITEERIRQIAENLPQTPWVKQDEFNELGVPESVAWNLLHSDYLSAFEAAIARFPEKAPFLAQLTTQYIPSEMKKRGHKWDIEAVEKLLNLACEQNLTLETVIVLLKGASPDPDWKAELAKMELTSVTDEQIDAAILEVRAVIKVKKTKGRFPLGLVKSKLPPSVSGKRIAERAEIMLQ